MLIVEDKPSLLSPAKIPPHLDESLWLDFEEATALACSDALDEELSRLYARTSAKRVHDSRVALRRWSSIWAVLKQDGWESKKLTRQVTGKLRKLLKNLGRLRDWDVNLELGEALGCTQPTLKRWLEQRSRIRKRVKALIKDLKVHELVAQLKRQIQRRYNKIRGRLVPPGLESLRPGDQQPAAATGPGQISCRAGGSAAPMESAYQHLERYIRRQEELVRKLEATATTAEELHRLRLAVKRWRYLLTEFYGVTNLQLVKAQQILGKLNDLGRLSSLMGPAEAGAVQARLQEDKQKLLAEFAQFRKKLPYGLRPAIFSSVESR